MDGNQSGLKISLELEAGREKMFDLVGKEKNKSLMLKRNWPLEQKFGQIKPLLMQGRSTVCARVVS